MGGRGRKIIIKQLILQHAYTGSSPIIMSISTKDWMVFPPRAELHTNTHQPSSECDGHVVGVKVSIVVIIFIDINLNF